MKLMQVMAGAPFGGAEEFFVRMAIALQKTNIKQRVLIRENRKRADQLLKSGVYCSQLRFGGKLDFFTRLAIKNQIRKFKPDIIFSWMNRATSMCPATEGVVHVGRLGGYYNLKYYDHCDYLIANTEDIANYLVNNGWDRDRVQFLPNFVYAKRAPSADRSSFFTPENAFLILGMGRFHENKAFDILLDAVAKIPDVYLWLVGDGPLKKHLEEYSEKVGVRPRTRFIGWTHQPEKFFAAADLLVCPSRHEPLGNVIIEAWAQKLAVIASETPGPQSLIRHGENGLLFPIDDSGGLRDAINVLAENNQLKEQLAFQAYQDFEGNYNENVIVEKYIQFFNRITR